MKIVFMGTPEFAVPSLEMLVAGKYEVIAVITQPDKPKGRGNKLAAPPVKEYALKAGIPVFQPAKIKTQDFANEIRALKPDLFITVAYGKIIPDYILDIPSLGCINVHGSLLPKYRGPAPMQWSIINGDSVTGITTMYTDVGTDTGDMLLKREIKIPDDMTIGELHDKMAVLGAKVLKDTLIQLENGTLKRTPQPHQNASYAPMIEKETGRIDWGKPARDIHNLVRGLDPWPGSFTFYKGERMRIWKTYHIDGENSGKAPGTILKADKEGICTAAGEGIIRIVEVQFDSGKRMNVRDYLIGHKIDEGEIFG